MRLRTRTLTAYPTCRVVRPSMAERRPLVFCETCGVTPSRRISATKSRVSYALSPPRVMRPALGQIPDHREGRLALRGSGRRRQCRIHHQAVAVPPQRMSHVTPSGGLPGRLLEQPGVRIGAGGVRFVAALLATEVARAVAAQAGRLAA